jgi:ankyrin repeat protein
MHFLLASHLFITTVSAVKLLLEKGAEPESNDDYGQTPLLRAMEWRHKAVVMLLLEKGSEKFQ